MSTTSERLGLILDALGDAADIRVLSANFELLDSIIGGGESNLAVTCRADALAATIAALSRNLAGRKVTITVTADTGAIEGDVLISNFHNGTLQITFSNNSGDTVGTTCDHAFTVKDNSARIDLVNTWLVSSSVNLVFDIDASTVHYYTKFKVYGETATGTSPLLVHNGGRLIGIDGAIITGRSKAGTPTILVYDGGEIVSPAAIAAVTPDRVLYVYSCGVVRVNGIARPDQVKVATGGQLICKAQKIPLQYLQTYVTGGVGDKARLVEMNAPAWWVFESGDMAHTELAKILPLAIKNGILYGFAATGAIPNDALNYTLWDDDELPGGGTGGHIQFVGSAAQAEGFVSVEELAGW